MTRRHGRAPLARDGRVVHFRTGTHRATLCGVRFRRDTPLTRRRGEVTCPTCRRALGAREA